MHLSTLSVRLLITCVFVYLLAKVCIHLNPLVSDLSGCTAVYRCGSYVLFMPRGIKALVDEV